MPDTPHGPILPCEVSTASLGRLRALAVRLPIATMLPTRLPIATMLSTRLARTTAMLPARLASLIPRTSFSMGYPSSERFRRRRQVDRHHLARRHIRRRCRTELRSV